jgi:hypothetical protein
MKKLFTLIATLLLFIFLISWLLSWVAKDNMENCERLGKHLNAEKAEWIPTKGCWIDGKYYG